MIQDSCSRMGIQAPDAVFSSVNQEIVQMRTLLNQEGKELNRRVDWQSLMMETSFTSVAQETQTSAVPADFDHYIADTMFDRTENRKIAGPLNSYEWQREKSGPVYTSVYHAFRIRGNNILITPNPTAGNSIYYEYISNKWAEDSSGTDKVRFTADDDVSRLDEEIMTLGVIWRFQKAKGLDYSESFRSYELMIQQVAARDESAPVLSLSRGLVSRRYYDANIKDGNWP